jgi:branched-subunit amino acid aminotransferase/4-amino-4-deoxychorismate lyase
MLMGEPFLLQPQPQCIPGAPENTRARDRLQDEQRILADRLALEADLQRADALVPGERRQQRLLRQLSAEAGATETILFRDGKLTEASSSNVFIVKGGTVVTPPKGNLILPGITYDVVVELAQANGVALQLREVAEAEVRSADEVWVTSSSKEVFPIVELDGRKVGDGKPGPAFRRMYRLYQEFKQKVMRSGAREPVSA